MAAEMEETMKPVIKKPVVIAMVVLCLGLPGALLAGERRGADLMITRKDGGQVSGELIAVKQDSLLLVSPGGKDESVDLVDIATIRIKKKSKALGLALGGFGVGAVGGALWWRQLAEGDMEGLAAFLGGALMGAIGAVLGLGTGLLLGIDKTIEIEGKSGSEAGKTMAYLRGKARIRDLR
jgi:hypothetical protein